jgi:hypothetical protein
MMEGVSVPCHTVHNKFQPVQVPTTGAEHDSESCCITILLHIHAVVGCVSSYLKQPGIHDSNALFCLPQAALRKPRPSRNVEFSAW